MKQQEDDQQWEQRSQQVAKSMQEWRLAHPQATLADIEEAVDQQMNELRARMIEDLAQANQADQGTGRSKPVACPECGKRMQVRGKRERRLQTQGGQEVTLIREYQSCPHCGYSFFPPR
ncbi:hypothetical protein [Ktedonospora formicarum]|uniref:Uncharacterized protein n=1 Tax=Ktedonospora formicarum TaxID=2778364 RepID=A0A8J3I7Y6_9CHLR|nr:hypothetical protein [Ktedonospora formicarum]GHO44962.1 hypothetical protein KSX_31250 [Ktedonospora formicarum]GHO45566.1 hypothetical protein KSX_37290 [Ktedonospora formicarum]GHO45645.1 hypothetical protein KSX_38080 [Ktedonospora formicarum]GHO45960.1 hypothetical protein KSX_41230 [Ktedonospora formicarum]GHO48636.1 hypothetical protein KSX_67990 [Ktedonospora formicarum]